MKDVNWLARNMIEKYLIHLKHKESGGRQLQ